MKKKIHTTFFAALAVFGAAVFNYAQAATLDLTPEFPDLTTFSASFVNDYTPAQCEKTGGGGPPTGDCGTGKYTGPVVAPAFGVFTMTGSTMALNIDGSGLIGVSGGGYTLTANFDDTGGFMGGSLTATGTTTDPQFQSGTIVTGDLFNFGFGGSDAGGIFEFQFNNVGGDMAAFGGLGGVIASTTNMTGWAGDWDPLLDNNPDFWQRDFTASGNVDTFVPIPGAIWLFGSGLLGLLSAGRARRG